MDTPVDLKSHFSINIFEFEKNIYQSIFDVLVEGSVHVIASMRCHCNHGNWRSLEAYKTPAAGCFIGWVPSPLK